MNINVNAAKFRIVSQEVRKNSTPPLSQGPANTSIELTLKMEQSIHPTNIATSETGNTNITTTGSIAATSKTNLTSESEEMSNTTTSLKLTKQPNVVPLSQNSHGQPEGPRHVFPHMDANGEGFPEEKRDSQSPEFAILLDFSDVIAPVASPVTINSASPASQQLLPQSTLEHGKEAVQQTAEEVKETKQIQMGLEDAEMERNNEASDELEDASLLAVGLELESSHEQLNASRATVSAAPVSFVQSDSIIDVELQSTEEDKWLLSPPRPVSSVSPIRRGKQKKIPKAGKVAPSRVSCPKCSKCYGNRFASAMKLHLVLNHRLIPDEAIHGSNA